jgi:hypothetical protein
MPTLKTTISLESSNLLASALKSSKVVTEDVNGGDVIFEQNQIPAAQSEILFDSTGASGTFGVLYFYCESISGNSGYGVDIEINNKSQDSAIFARLLPGDFVYLPLYAADSQGITVSAANTDPSQPATINYFFGSKD